MIRYLRPSHCHPYYSHPIPIGTKASSKVTGRNAKVSASGDDVSEEGDDDDLITLLPLIQQCLAPPVDSSSGSNRGSSSGSGSDSSQDDTAAAAVKRCRDTNTPFGLSLASQLEELLAHPSQGKQPQGAQGEASVLEKWFQLTRIAGQTKATTQGKDQGKGKDKEKEKHSEQGSTLESVCRMEITANTIILQQQ